MTRANDPVTLALTGALPFILILAPALALPVSIGLLKLYRRAVLKSMLARANPRMTGAGPPEASAPSDQPVRGRLGFAILDRASSITAGPVAKALYSTVLRAPWRAAAIYAVAGFCYALVMVATYLAATNSELLPFRFLVLFWIYAWPVVLTVNLVAAPSQRAKLATASVYFLILAAIGAIGIARSPTLSWDQVVVLWLLTNLPATVLLLAFLNRRVRAVGPLVLTFMIVATTGSILAPFIAGSDERMLRAVVDLGLALGLDAVGVFIGLHVLGFVMLGLAGWLALRWIGGLYERKKISDQSITLDAIWLLFGVSQSVSLVFEGAAWMLAGLLAFAIHKGVARAGFSLLYRKAGPARESPKLLLLRVFSLGKRSERLFDALGTRWRHAGSIQLIAGPDLATTTVEPHEFLDFLSGRLARRFITGPETLDLRLSETDGERDRDGRFRVNDFFCHDDTWRMVLSRLVSESDAVLMDLRGFSPQKAGCVFEIDELINVVPLERVVFVIDDTTDEPFLRQTVQHSWDRMRPTSPNRLSDSEQLRLFRFGGPRRGNLRQLLRCVCVAARAGSSRALRRAPLLSADGFSDGAP